MFTVTNLLLGLLLVSLWLLSAEVIRRGCNSIKAPQPGLPGAMMLVLLAAGGAVSLQFVMSMMTGFSMLGMRLDPAQASQMRVALAVPIWMLVSASVYRAMLPTTFGKATLLFIAQAVVSAAALLGVSLLANLTNSSALMQARSMLPL